MSFVTVLAYAKLNIHLINHVQAIEEVLLYGETKPSKKLPITSFNIKNIAPIHLASMLYKEHQIITRAGIHGAPLIHKVIGTDPMGYVRVSIGHANVEADSSILVHVIKKIIKRI